MLLVGTLRKFYNFCVWRDRHFIAEFFSKRSTWIFFFFFATRPKKKKRRIFEIITNWLYCWIWKLTKLVRERVKKKYLKNNNTYKVSQLKEGRGGCDPPIDFTPEISVNICINTVDIFENWILKFESIKTVLVYNNNSLLREVFNFFLIKPKQLFD